MTNTPTNTDTDEKVYILVDNGIAIVGSKTKYTKEYLDKTYGKNKWVDRSFTFSRGFDDSSRYSVGLFPERDIFEMFYTAMATGVLPKVQPFYDRLTSLKKAFPKWNG